MSKENSFRFTIFLLFLFTYHFGYSQNEIQVIPINKGEQYLSSSSDGNQIYQWNAFSQNLEFRYEGLKSKPLKIFYREFEKEIVAIDSNEVIIWNPYNNQPKKRFALPKEISADLGNTYNYTNSFVELHKDLLYLGIGRSLVEISFTKGSFKILKEFESFISGLSYCESAAYLLVDENIVPRRIHHFNILSGKMSSIADGASINSSVNPNGDFTIYDYYSKKGEVFSSALKKKNSYFISEDVGYSKPLFIHESILVFPYTDSSVYVYNIETNFCSNLGLANGGGKLSFLDGYFFNCSRDQNNVAISTFYQFISARQNFTLEGINNSDSFQVLKSGSIGETNFTLGGENFSFPEHLTSLHLAGNKTYFGASGGSFGICTNSAEINSLDKISNAVTALASTDSILYIGSIGRIVTYDLRKKSFGHSFRAHNGFVNHLCLSPNEQFLLSVASDGTVFLWDLKKQSLLAKYWFNTSILSCVLRNDLSFSLLLSNGENYEKTNENLLTRFYSSGIEVKTRLGHSSSIRSMDISRNGDYLVSVDGEGVIKIWLTTQMIPIHTLQFEDGVKKLMFIENGNSFFAFSGNCIHIVDTKSGELIRKTPIPSMYGNFMILDVAAANNGRFFLISCVNSDDVYFYNLITNSFGWFCSGSEQYSVKNLTFHPTNDSIFVTYGKEAIYVLESGQGSLMRKIPNPNNSNSNAYANYTLSFSPDGKLLLADYNDSLRVFDFISGNKLATYKGFIGFFNSESTVLVCGYFPGDQTTRYWTENVYTKKREYERALERHDYLSGEFAFDRTRNLLYVSKNSEIKLINIRSGQFIDRQAGMAMQKVTAQFDPVLPGKLIVSLNHEIKTVDAASGKTESVWDLKGDRIYFKGDKTKFAIYKSGDLNIYTASDKKLQFQIQGSDEATFTNHGQIIGFSHLDGLQIVNENTGGLIYINGGVKSKDVLKSYVYLPPTNTVLLVLYKSIPNSQKMNYSERIEAMINATYMIEIDAATGKENFRKDLPVQFTDMIFSAKGQLGIKANFRQYKLVKDNVEVIVNSDLFIDNMYFSDDGNYFYLTDSEGQLECYNTSTGDLIFKNRRHDKVITQLSWKDNILMTVGRDGKVILLKADDGTLIGTYIFFAGEDHVMIDPNNYYKGSKKGVESIYFKKGENYYPIEQFDAIQNRPDLVLKSFGEKDEAILSAYALAVEKRLTKLGLKQIKEKNDFSLPNLNIKSKMTIPLVTSNSLLSFDLNGKSVDHNLKSLHVWINDVPLYGMKGLTDGIEGLRIFGKTLQIELAEGNNKLQFALMNDLGIESEKQTFYINYEPSEKITKKLYLVNLGVSQYIDSSYNLRYAAKDAKDLGDLYRTSTNGIYDSIIQYSLTDKDLTTKNVLDLKKHLLKAGRNDCVIITFAGHGVLDESYNYYLATHDMDFRNPTTNGLPYEGLEYLLDGITPLKKALFIDACHSGEVEKEDLVGFTSGGVISKKVGRGADVEYVGDQDKLNTTELSKELFNDLRRGTGATIISASGGLESAIESAQWQNGLFTYCILIGLEEMAADKNEDGKIMLSELQEYLQSEVYKKSNGLQKPTSRVENLELDWRVW